MLAYVLPLALMTAHYALFQAANNTAVIGDAAAEHRGVVSGLLNLSRNLLLMAGATVLGAESPPGDMDVASASAGAVAGAVRMTFGVGALLVAVALAGGTLLAPRAHCERRS